MTEKKRPAHRPSEYKPEYCEKIIKLMSEGYSIEAFAGSIGVTKKTVYSWLKQHPEFLYAQNVGITASQLFWERVGLAGMAGKIENFNSAIWIFNMKNRFNWRDRVEALGEIQIIESRDKIKELINDPKYSEAALLLAEKLIDNADQ